MKNEIHNVLSGKISVRFGATIQAIPVTLQKARQQAQKLKTVSISKNKKQRA
jgi:hypothetical protein